MKISEIKSNLEQDSIKLKHINEELKTLKASLTEEGDKYTKLIKTRTANRCVCWFSFLAGLALYINPSLIIFSMASLAVSGLCLVGNIFVNNKIDHSLKNYLTLKNRESNISMEKVNLEFRQTVLEDMLQSKTNESSLLTPKQKSVNKNAELQTNDNNTKLSNTSDEELIV